MEKWIHVREPSGPRFNDSTGEKLPVEYTSYIKNEAGDIVGMAADTHFWDGVSVTKSGALERGNIIAAAPDAIEFAKHMAEFFAHNPNGYEDLRSECQAVLQRAFPAVEVADAS
jgi:hypothetical protein